PVLKTITSEDVFVYMGCRIIRGSAKGTVIALGQKTVYGEIVTQAAPTSQASKYHQIELRHLWILLLLLPAFWQSASNSTNMQITTLLYILAGAMLFYFQQNEIINSFLLKHAHHAIEERHILIRYPELIPLLDEIDTICFDKTGVLTTRQLEASKFFVYSSLTEVKARCLVSDGVTKDLIKTASALCTDVSFFEKARFANPVDYAFISFAQSAGVDLAKISKKFHRIFDMPFDSEKRYMYCGYETEEQEQWYFLKGDPDLVLIKCKDYLDEIGEKRSLDFNLQCKIKDLSKSISQGGDTAIALAVAFGGVDPKLNEYAFLCLVQLENTLQENAKEVVERIIKRGIRPLLLTGDKSEAAVKIAHTCGIAQNSKAALSGNVIDRMPLDEVGRQAEYCSVFSRLLPSQKATIIHQLQNKGHHLIMVGDGPNDGIALHVADIGISFKNDSSPIARRFSSILLNRLTDLPALFEEGNTLKLRMKKLRCFMILISMILLAVVYIASFYR
ncbi:MAG TPA: HAD-IC family P-type ATPase, partial [Bellilinea sp.]|nr:HAD-IC family P-type ATPase [Bellilinea sp.]